MGAVHASDEEDVAAQIEFLAAVADHPIGDFHGFMGFDTLRELEEENRRLKRLVADLSLDVQILKDVNSKNW